MRSGHAKLSVLRGDTLTVLFVVLVIVMIGAILSIPGWVASAVWGWHYFAIAIPTFWVGGSILFSLVAAVMVHIDD